MSATVARLPATPADRPASAQPALPGLCVLLALAAGSRSNWPERLRSAGHRTVVVNDADAVLDALAGDAFDLLLLDLAVPDAVPTAKLYRFLSLDDPPMPIIGLTGPTCEAAEWRTGAIGSVLPLVAAARDAAALRANIVESPRPRAAAPDRCEVISIAGRRAMRSRAADAAAS